MSDRPTLRNANGPAAIIEAVARAAWAKEHDGDECPDNRIPSPGDMAAWTADGDGASEAARAEAGALLAALVPPDWHDTGKEAGTIVKSWPLGEPEPPTQPRHVVPDRVDMAETQRFMLVTGLSQPSMATVNAPSLDLYERLIVDAHRRRTDGRHPLAPLVADWQERAPVSADWDDRDSPVLSGTLAGREGGLRPLVVANDPRQLPLALSGDAGEPPRQLWLGFEQPEPDRVPVLPLVAFDASGGVSMTSGHGAAHAIRLYVEALLSLPPELRRVAGYGPPVRLHARLRDVIAGLWPRGWQRGRDWPRLLDGLDELRKLGVEWEHGGDSGVWFAVTVRSVPRTGAKLDDLVRFEVLLPPGSGPGPMVMRPHLRLLGTDSAQTYRLYLSLCWYWDHYGTAGGRLIGADPPQRRGKPVAPVKVGDKLVNPAALHRYPALTPDHLAQMAYAPADLAPEGTSYRRDQRQRARAALDRIAAQTGAVVIPAPGAVVGTVQVLPPASHKAAHDGKADLWRNLGKPT